MALRWTEAQIARAKEWLRLLDEDEDAQADEIYAELRGELGAENCRALLQYVEDLQENAVARTPKPKMLSQPRRVSQAAETWRCLNNYPLYEISSHGRVRALDRARPDDWLKPRRRWIRGHSVDFVVIKDRDGRRCERMIGKLLIAAGFLPTPEWMEKKSSSRDSVSA
jgi:hypothetical protein